MNESFAESDPDRVARDERSLTPVLVAGSYRELAMGRNPACLGRLYDGPKRAEVVRDALRNLHRIIARRVRCLRRLRRDEDVFAICGGGSNGTCPTAGHHHALQRNR